MKRIISVLIVLTLVLTLGMVVFADTTPADQPVDMTEVPFNKEFVLENADTISPEASFQFNVTALDGAPTIGSVTINADEGFATDTRQFTFDLPINYTSTGTYKYRIKEVQGNVAGVVYDDRELELTVYVLNNPEGGFIRYATIHDVAGEAMEKVDTMINEFHAGNLLIKKEVTGNMGETDREFNITVVLTKPEGKDITKVPVAYNGGKYTETAVEFNEDGVATLNLQIKHGDTITIGNLPYGVTWTLEEDDYSGDGYTTTIDKVKGTIAAAEDTATITNHKDQAIETGVNLDNLPYMLILAFVGLGLVGFVLRKRSFNR